MVATYATLTELRDRFAIADPYDDTVLDLVLDAVSRRISDHCLRIFWDAGLDDDGEVLQAPATARLVGPDHVRCGVVYVEDFSTTTGLVVKTDDNDDGTYETTWTISTDFQVEPLNGVVNGQPGWPYWRIRAVGSRSFPVSTTGRPTVQVTARWGWATVPSPVREACLLQAARLFDRKNSPLGVAGFADLGAVTRLLAKLDPDVEFMLSPYRKEAVSAG